MQALSEAAKAPSFATISIAIGGLIAWLFRRKTFVLGEVADIRVELAQSRAAEAACMKRTQDLEARINALETQIHDLTEALKT